MISSECQYSNCFECTFVCLCSANCTRLLWLCNTCQLIVYMMILITSYEKICAYLVFNTQTVGRTNSNRATPRPLIRVRFSIEILLISIISMGLFCGTCAQFSTPSQLENYKINRLVIRNQNIT